MTKAFAAVCKYRSHFCAIGIIYGKMHSNKWPYILIIYGTRRKSISIWKFLIIITTANWSIYCPSPTIYSSTASCIARDCSAAPWKATNSTCRFIVRNWTTWWSISSNYSNYNIWYRDPRWQSWRTKSHLVARNKRCIKIKTTTINYTTIGSKFNSRYIWVFRT